MPDETQRPETRSEADADLEARAESAAEEQSAPEPAHEPAAEERDGPPPPSEEDLPARVESLLFVSDSPVEESTLARALGVTPGRLGRALEALAERLRGGGVRLQRGPEGAQLVTAPEAAPYVEHFLGLEANRRLSTAALETLAIIAYRQPVTRGTIETIRGVSSDAAVATLRARGLIREAGRAEGPGRPLLFATTQRFLQHFGLERPDDLPPLPEDLELVGEDEGQQLALEGGPTLERAEVETAETGDEPTRDGQPAGEDEVEFTHDPGLLTQAAGAAFGRAAAAAPGERPSED